MDLIKKSKEVFENLQLDNGGILATPKNGAYPYIYPRDAVIITKAMNRLDMVDNSKKFYYFMNKNAKMEQYGEIFHRYNEQGLPFVTRKHEHDNTGLIVHGIYDTYLCCEDETFLQDMWILVFKCIKAIDSFMEKGLIETERSIHEFYRLENGYEIWANCACCRAYYDAAEIAKILSNKK